MSMKKATQRNGDQGDRVRNLQYTRDLPLDDGVNLPVLDSRPLHTLVDPSSLPMEYSATYNAKKGTFKSSSKRACADETILRSAQAAQGHLSHHMRTGYCPEPFKSKGKNLDIGGMGIPATWNGKGD
jgi:hypothetical protein